MLESCRRPELVTEITLQPVRRYGVDAAIFYSRHRRAAEGGRRRPRHRARRRAGGRGADPHRRRPRPRCRRSTPDRVPDIAESVRLLVAELGATPLIGFAGAPFTLASYLVEGGPSRDLDAHQGADVRRPGAVARPAGPPGADLRRVPAGAGRGRRDRGAAVRLVGRRAAAAGLPRARCCPPPRRRSPPSPGWTRRCRASTSASAPASCWPRWARPARTSSASTSACRWTRPSRRLGPAYAVQGNLDPALLFAPWDVAARAGARRPSRPAGRRRGTCSTSATASRRTPTPTCCSASSRPSTRSRTTR